VLYSLLFELKNLPFEYKLIIFLTFSFAVIVALTSHEFSHAFVATKMGDNTPKLAGRLSLNPMAHFDGMGLMCFILLGFGWAKPVPINPYNFKNIKKGSFLVSIAGITMNLILAFIFCPLSLLMLKNFSDTIAWYIFYYLFSYIYQINLVFMVFNILPIYPLDGFNAIASLVKYDNKYVNFMHKYGTIILLFVIILFSVTDLFGTLVSYIGYPITKFWSLIIF